MLYASFLDEMEKISVSLGRVRRLEDKLSRLVKRYDKEGYTKSRNIEVRQAQKDLERLKKSLTSKEGRRRYAIPPRQELMERILPVYFQRGNYGRLSRARKQMSKDYQQPLFRESLIKGFVYEGMTPSTANTKARRAAYKEVKDALRSGNARQKLLVNQDRGQQREASKEVKKLLQGMAAK